MDEKKYQIFISSTYEDLKEERQAAVEAVLRAGHIPAGMELFAAGDESQMETIKRWIDSSDIFMLILGGRYGSIEPKSKRSYIECEYNYAIEKGKPTFAIVIKDQAFEKKVKAIGPKIIEKENQKKLKDFKKKVLSNTASFYEDLKDIQIETHHSILNISQKVDLKGWINAEKLSGINTLISAIDSLTKENGILKSEIEELKNSKKNNVPSEENEYSQLIKTLENISIQLPGRSPTFLFNCFYNSFSKLVLGIVRKPTSFSYFCDPDFFTEICTKLEIHGLTKLEVYTQFVVYKITEKGKKLLAYYERKKYSK